MRVEKPNFTAYSSLSKFSSDSRTTNISDLIRRNKEVEKKERILKIYTLLGFAGLFLFLGLCFYL